MSDQKTDCEEVMNEVLDFAEKMLRSHSEFHPFGAYLLEGRSVVHVGISSDQIGKGSGAQKAAELEGNLRSIATTLRARAVAMATNVAVRNVDGELEDAIQINVEHRSGYCAEVFFPYFINGHNNVRIGSPTAQKGRPGRFFG